MRRLFSEGKRVPVGRMKSLLVGPFSFVEFCRYVKGDELADWIASVPDEVPPSRHDFLLDLYDSYLVVGGYPEAVKAFSRGEPAREVIREIVAQLEEDFLRKEDCQPGLFNDALRAVADHAGSPSNISHVNATRYYAAMFRWSVKAVYSTPRLTARHGLETRPGEKPRGPTAVQAPVSYRMTVSLPSSAFSLNATRGAPSRTTSEV